MAITIPRVQQFQTADAMPSNPRINQQAQNNASGILSQTQDVVEVVDKGADIYQAYENEAIDNLSREAKRNYSAWAQQQLRDIEQFDGDPTDRYAQFDQAAAEKQKEILEARPDLSERVKRHLTSNLNSSAQDIRVAADFQRGKQVEVYQNNLFESDVKLQKNDLAKNIGYVRGQKDEAGNFTVDDSTYFMFDKGVNQLKTSIVKQGLKKGTATEVDANSEDFDYAFDDNGTVRKVKLSPMVKMRIAKDLSEGVSESLDALVSSGNVELAKAAKEKYKSYLTTDVSSALDKKLGNIDTRREADSFLAFIKGKSQEAQIEAIDKIQDGELRSKVLQIKDADDRRIENMRKRKEDTNYDTLSKHVNRLVAGGGVYGYSDLEKDPLFQKTWNNLNAKQQEEIRNRVETPKISDPKAKAAAQDLIFGNGDKDISEMTENEINLKLSRLNKEDRAYYTKEIEKLKTPSNSQLKADVKFAGQLIRNKLLRDEVVSKNRRTGKFSQDDENLLTDAQDKFGRMILENPGVFTTNKLPEMIDKYVADKIYEKVYSPDTVNAFRRQAPSKNVTGAERQDTNAVTTDSDGNLRMSSAQQKLWMIRYSKTTGVKLSPDRAKDMDILEQYIKRNMNK